MILPQRQRHPAANPRATCVLICTLICGGIGCAQVHGAPSAEPAAVSPPAVDFTRQVLPIIAKRCLACHGPDKAEGGLRLTSLEAATAALESEAHAIVPGNVDQSELLRRVATTEESERMPPEGDALSSEQIEILRRWIAEGATWKEHWAFGPLTARAVPEVTDKSWAKNPVDAFILHRLESAGLKPAPPAEKRMLLRRIYYDLTGLPPSPAEAKEFLEDDRPDAYEKLVDRLLASPRYGERWGRHWLDVVRFAETNSFERDTVKPHAWRYRDYVIQSLNDDKPFDQFAREQLAGDELDVVTKDSLIATGYYRLGLWDDEPADPVQARYDVLDDIVATTAQAFLGLTLNCARCHDHKIDPILQKDYYSLLSFFHGITPMAVTGKKIETEVFDNPQERTAYESRVGELEAKRDDVQSKLTVLEDEFQSRYNAQAPAGQHVVRSDFDELEYRFYREQWDALPDFDLIRAESRGEIADRLVQIDPQKGLSDFAYLFVGALKVPADGEYSFTLDSDDGSRLMIDDKTVVDHDGLHALGKPKTGQISLKQGRVSFRLEYFQKSQAQGLELHWTGPGFAARPLSGQATPEQKRFAAQLRTEGPKVLGDKRFQEYQALTKKLHELKGEDVPVARALVVREVGPQTPETFVLVRGNAHTKGVCVEPAFPAIFNTSIPRMPAPSQGATSSGRRLALANWIVSRDNRLTSRVIANRIWQHHFGRGIVRSPNNFGLLGDPPTHPDLLDWLANQLVKYDWRLKPLHRLIVTSSAYRMSSRANPAGLAKDPANELFWRFDMRRLSGEEIRDSMLTMSGRLNLKMYGPGFYPDISAEVLAGQSRPGEGWGKSTPVEQARRSIYIHVKRSLITPILADFDFADTDSSCPARFITTQPSQALGQINGQFATSQATEFAARLRREASGDVRAQIGLALRLALCREPDPSSIERGLALIDDLERKHGQSADQALAQYCLMVLNLNEFVYLD